MLHPTLVLRALKHPLLALEHMEIINQPVDQTIELVKVELAAESHMDLNKDLEVPQHMGLLEHLDHHMELVELPMPKEQHMAHHQEPEVEVELEVQAMAKQDHHHIPELMGQQQEQLELQEPQEHHHHLDIPYQDQVQVVMEHQEQDIMEETKSD